MNSFIVVRHEYNVDKAIEKRAEETPHLLERERVTVNLENESFHDKGKALHTVRHYPLEPHQLLVATVVERFFFLPEFYVTGPIGMTEGQAKSRALRQHQYSTWTRLHGEKVHSTEVEETWRIYQSRGAELMTILAWAS